MGVVAPGEKKWNLHPVIAYNQISGGMDFINSFSFKD